jgi:uncharacterized membrane protein HdeD (DUF308 family)
MTVEYIVLGALLIVMGGVQVWLRHGPGGKALRADEGELAERRAKAIAAGETQPDAASRAAVRSGKAWNSWTAVLGIVAIVLGIVLVVFGVLGY